MRLLFVHVYIKMEEYSEVDCYLFVHLLQHLTNRCLTSLTHEGDGQLTVLKIWAVPAPQKSKYYFCVFYLLAHLQGEIKVCTSSTEPGTASHRVLAWAGMSTQRPPSRKLDCRCGANHAGPHKRGSFSARPPTASWSSQVFPKGRGLEECPTPGPFSISASCASS